MRRWIAVFFLVLFPLQAVWAAAAPYCQHEQEPASFHIGHHSHDHHPGSSADDTADKLLPGMEDGDCTACHAFCSALQSVASNAQAALIDVAPPTGIAFPVPTPPQSPPERPNWRALA